MDRHVTRLVFVRHGQSTANLERRAQGQMDTQLTELGRQQALEVAELLKDWHFDATYSSDLSRAYDTGKAIAARHPGLVVIKEPRLREMYIGYWQGVLSADIARMYPEEHYLWRNDWWNARPGGGESMPELAERSHAIAWEIADANKGGTVLITSHGTFMRTLLLDWLGLPGERIMETPDIHNCGVYAIDYDTENRTTTPVVMGLTAYEKDETAGAMGSEP